MSRQSQQPVHLNDARTTDAPEEAPTAAPSLSQLHEAVTRGLAAAAEAMLGAQARAALTGVDQSDTRTFVASLGELSCAFRLPAGAGGAAEAPATAWIELPVRLAGSIVDRMLGGAGDDETDDRALTRTERRLLRRFVARWTAPVVSVLDRAGAGGVEPGRPAAVLSFEAGVGAVAGTVKLCVPAGVLGGRGVVSAEAASGPVEIRVAVEQPADAAALADLEAGDIIDTEMPVDGEVIVRVAGIPKYAGRLRTCDGRRAVEIVRRLGEPPADGHESQGQDDPDGGEAP